ncbi:restriction endonuclease [Halopelagius fulvigenes]|uniref:Restriction endonuclease n=1 Tax=Halopelagius fulvigenes TaxID=1198324 RepID=A0ABD5U5G0_9EURY
MIPELEPEDFVSFLGDLWGERGWETTVQERANGTYFIIGERGDGRRGVLFVFPTTESHVSGQHLRRFVTLCGKKGVDVAVVATQGAYADEARKIADAKGIHLLDRTTLEGTVEEGGFHHVLRKYTGGGPLDPILAKLRALGLPVPETLPFDLPFDPAELQARIRSRLGGYSDGTDDSNADGPPPDGEGDGGGGGRFDALPVSPRTLLPVVVAVVLLVVAGSATGALTVPGMGSGGGDTAVSAVSTAGANAALDVRWNAETTDSVTINGTTYDAPENETFVVVRMNVTSLSESPEQLSQAQLALEVAGDRYGYQPLRNSTGFPSAGLFAPGESREVWTVFSVPADAESGTLLVRSGEDVPGVKFTRDTAISAEATEL